MRIRRGRRALLLLAATGFIAIGIAAALKTAWRPQQSRTSVVIITLDTTRVDRLSPYGLMNASMPALERLAREGVVFDQATSVAPLTLPAHTSLFTGLLPTKHLVRDNADAALGEEFVTLADILGGRGFRTGAFVGSIVLDAVRGLKQGFEHYDGVDLSGAPPGSLASRARQRRGADVATAAIRWLEGVDGPFLLWMQLYDPHRPYDPPEPYRSAYNDAYIGEIAYADAQIGRVLEALDRRGLAEHTIVVIAGDHGESLGEHGERDHGVFVYESVLKIPLIVRAPSIAPRRVGGVVRLTDVMPTVLELLRMPAPAVDGVSLVDLLTGRHNDLQLEAYSESLYPRRFGWSPLHALREGRYKLIDAPRPELYDLERDPFEQHNVYQDRQSTAAAMRRRLRTITGLARGVAAAPAKPASAELASQLSSLGYVGSSAPAVTSAISTLPDPKDCIGLFRPVDDLRSPSATPPIPCEGPDRVVRKK